jgi:hypothetical protein
MTPVELKSFRQGIFSERETLREALEYAHMVAKGSDHPPAVLAAVYVVLNTVINELNKDSINIH